MPVGPPIKMPIAGPNSPSNAPVTLPAVSTDVPRRRPGSKGVRSHRFPDLNYQVIADVLGVNSTYLGRVLNGYFRPSMPLAAKIAAYFDWSIDNVNNLYVLTQKENQASQASREEQTHAESANANRGDPDGAVGTKRRGKRGKRAAASKRAAAAETKPKRKK